MIPKWRTQMIKHVKMPKTPTEMQKIIIDALYDDPLNKKEPVTDDILYEENARPPSPPDFVKSVIGTNVGGGAGEFHVYRIQKKFENRRVKFFEHQLKEEKAQLEFDRNKKILSQMESEKTEARRNKRIQKRKNAQERKKLHKQFADVLNEYNKAAEEFHP